MPMVTLDYKYSVHDKERQYYLECFDKGAWYFWLGYHLADSLPVRLRKVRIYSWGGKVLKCLGNPRRLREWNTASAAKCGGLVALAIAKNEAALNAAGKP